MNRGLPILKIISIFIVSAGLAGCYSEEIPDSVYDPQHTNEIFSVVDTSPKKGAKEVPLDQPITVTLNSVVDGRTISPNSFFIMDYLGNRVSGTRSMWVDPEKQTTTLAFFPNTFRMILGEQYVLQVNHNMRDVNYRYLRDYSSTFSATTRVQDVKDGTGLKILSMTPGNIITDTGQSPARYIGLNKRTPIYIRFSEPVESPFFWGDFAPVPLKRFKSMTIRVVKLLWDEAIDSAINRVLREIENGNYVSDIEGTVRGGLGGRRFVFEPSEDYPEIYMSMILVYIHPNFNGTFSQKKFDHFMVGGFMFTNGFEFEWNDPRYKEIPQSGEQGQ